MSELSLEQFTEDEFELMAIHYRKSRTATMKRLAEKRDCLTDGQAKERALFDSTLEKMKTLSNEEFKEIEDYVIFDED